MISICMTEFSDKPCDIKVVETRVTKYSALETIWILTQYKDVILPV